MTQARQTGPHARRLALYVEDNPLNRLLMTQIFELYEDWSLVCAEDGEAGIEALSRERPQVVLIDMRLPDISGVELLARMRGTDAGRGIPYVLVTAEVPASTESATKGEPRFDRVIYKPFDASGIVPEIAALVDSFGPRA